MSAKKFGLNKGLDALLQDVISDKKPLKAKKGNDVKVSHGGTEVDISALQPGRFQPRGAISDEEVESLAKSIRSQGVIQPVVVRPLTNKTYEIIAGERRFRASKLAGLKQIPIIVKDVTEDAAFAIAIIENVQRENLNPMEEARAYHRLSEEYSLSHEKIATAVGKSRSSITNLLRLLSLRKEVQVLLERNDLEIGHAKVILSLPQQMQVNAAREVVSKSLSVRETEKMVSLINNPDSKKTPSAKTVDPDLKRLVQGLSDKLGAKVKIDHNNRGKGKIVISYNSLDELDGILSNIN